MAATINIYPSVPTLTTPAAFANIAVDETFTGAKGNSGSDGATSYRFQTSEDGTTGTLIDDVTGLETPEYQISSYENGIIYWRMASVAATSQGTFTNWTAWRVAEVGNNPSNVSAPVIGLTPVIGTEHAGDDGEWTGTPTLDYQWQYNSASPTNISGATSKDYANTDDAYFGYPLRLAVHDSVGDTTVYSNWTSNLREQPTQSAVESLGNPNMDWSGGNLAAWEGQAGTKNGNPGWSQIDSGGGAGSNATRFQSTATNNSPALKQTGALTPGDWYDYLLDISSLTAGSYWFYDGVAAFVNTTGAKVNRGFRRPAGSTIYVYARTAPSDFAVNTASMLHLTPNPVLTAPNADMRLSQFYTLPGTPTEGTSVRLFFRVSDFAAGNYLVCDLKYTGGQWQITVYSAATFSETARVATVTDVGVTNGIQLVVSGNSITVYKTANGGATWTYVSDDATTIYNTDVGVTTMWTRDVTIGECVWEDPAAGPLWYADAAGSPTGQGTEIDPFSIERGFTATDLIQSGHTLYVSGHWEPTAKSQNITIGGAVGQRVTIEPKTGEIFRFDCGLVPKSPHLRINGRYRMIQETPGVSHVSSQSGTTTPPTDIRSYIGIAVNNIEDVEVINVRQDGLTWGAQQWFTAGGTMYGNVVNSCGVISPDREHGPGNYGSKPNPALVRRFEQNIYLNPYRYTPQYTSEGETTENMTFKDSTIIGVAGYFGGEEFHDLTLDGMWWLTGYPLCGLYQSALEVSTGLHLTNCVTDPEDSYNQYAYYFNQVEDVVVDGHVSTYSAYVNNEVDGGSYTIPAITPFTGVMHEVLVNEFEPTFATVRWLDAQGTPDDTLDVDCSAFMTSGTVRVHNPMKWNATEFGDEYEDYTVTAGHFTLDKSAGNWTTPIPTGLVAAYPIATVFTPRRGVLVMEDVTA